VQINVVAGSRARGQERRVKGEGSSRKRERFIVIKTNYTDVLAFAKFDPSVERWASIRVSARWEKKLARALVAIKVPVFLPLIERVTKYKTKTNRVLIPIFGGYLFFDESRLSDLSVLSSESKRYVAQVLKTTDHQLLRRELSVVAELISDKNLVQERIFGQAGDIVRIKAGPFKEYSGIIRNFCSGNQRIQLNISYLGASVEVEVNVGEVEKT